jgi:multiple RNA-binding domain-containing protein 1
MFAIIDFENPDEARLAFIECNNITMTGGKKMYLEKGPIGLFKDVPKEPELPTGGTVEGEGPTDESGPTLYIKNLSFSTTTEQLISKVSHLPGYVFARVHMKENPKKGGARLSAGYGFAGFRNLEQATSALAKLQGYELDGKTLQVNFSKRVADDAEPRRGKGELRSSTKSTKLMVKNVPFEAKKEDLRTLFNAHGRVKSVRMPKKAVIGTSGSLQPKGFAFIDFTTHDEAKRAMDALKATHLYGRHLVTQFAAPEDETDVGALREKTGREWTGLQRAGEGVRTKKRKIGQGDADEEMDGLE